MNEVSFYPEFSIKFKHYIQTYFGEQYQVYYAYDNTLNKLVEEIETNSGLKIKKPDEYIPKLKLDILFAICKDGFPPKLILIEAKYLPQLSLKDYSQLAGYLQVAKTIEIGILLLIQKPGGNNKLSNEFSEIVRLKKLPMDWTIKIKNTQEEHLFKTGIISYIQGNGIDWVNTSDINGISSFEQLVELVR
jgi:hypothetical protein